MAKPPNTTPSETAPLTHRQVSLPAARRECLSAAPQECLSAAPQECLSAARSIPSWPSSSRPSSSRSNPRRPTTSNWPSPARTWGPARTSRSAKGRGPARAPGAGKGTWAAVSVLCVVIGAILSLLAAHSLARNDASKARATFQQSSSGIASNLKLAIQREEELAVSASTFFTANPKASHAEFATWVKWARTLHRYPELTNLGLLTVVPAAQLTAFQAQISGHALKAPAAGSAPTATGSAQATGTGLRATSSTGVAARPTTPTGPPLHIVPPSNHPYYCLAVAELARNPTQTPPPGLDYCASSAALLSARDSGLSSHTPLAAGPTRALAVETPVYRGNVTPRSLFGRRAASVGWLREVLRTRSPAATGPGEPPGLCAAPALPGRLRECRLHQRHPTLRRAEHDGQPAQWMEREELRSGGQHGRARGRGCTRATARRNPAQRAARPAGIRPLRPAHHTHAGAEAGRRAGAQRGSLRRAHRSPQPRAHTGPCGADGRAGGTPGGNARRAPCVDIDWFKDVNDKLGPPPAINS